MLFESFSELYESCYFLGFHKFYLWVQEVIWCESKLDLHHLVASDCAARWCIWRPDDETEARDHCPVVDITVVAIAADDFLARFQVDVGKRPVTTLRTDTLDTRLILVEVNVWDHLVELNSGGDIVAPIMSILVVIEGVRVEDNWRLLFVKRRAKKWTWNVMADKFDCSNHAQRILLVPDFLQSQLLNLVDLFELGLRGPLEVVLAQAVVIRLKHRQLANAVLRQLNL